MAQNYVLLERIELNATAASVTFSNIPQTGYTDLKLVSSARCTTVGYYSGYQQAMYARFNSSSTSYSHRWLQSEGNNSINSGNNSYFTAGTSYAPIATIDPSDWTANTFGNAELYIPNYTGSNFKSYSADASAENNGTFGSEIMFAGLWSNTAAITSIALTLASGSFAAGSTFSLYGIANASTTPAIAPKADGGNVIATDGTYWYHAFLSSGTFTPQTNLTCDYLVIAGGGSGGAGGANVGGGGGAGGLLYATGSSFTATGYTVTIGAGGASANQTDGNNGTNSSFNSSTAVGGGGGAGTAIGAGTARAGKSGGSGGGASYWNSGTAAGGAATSGQGNKGGDITSSVNNNRAGAGGGGAGVAGANVVTNGTGTAGGNGSNTYSAWATATSTGVGGYYAGGGASVGDAQSGSGAISGGLGGGGNAQWVVNGVAGVTNTGSGGGGSIDSSTVSGAGGSGIVIVRYLAA